MEWYKTDPDAGVHGAIDWLLRHEKDGPNDRPLAWGQRTALAAIDWEFKARFQSKRAAAVAGQLAVLMGEVQRAEVVIRTVAATRASAGAGIGEPSGVSRRVKLNNPAADAARLANPTWFVNGQGQTFTVIDSREAFLMGSPVSETAHTESETLHWRKIGRQYALQTKAVTVADFSAS